MALLHDPSSGSTRAGGGGGMQSIGLLYEQLLSRFIDLLLITSAIRQKDDEALRG